ncbi:MAG: EamA family transporter, partial [Candidatus Limnocylindrales bacterium]
MSLSSVGLLLALFSAVSWGIGDFAGGLASRRSTVLAVLAATQLIGVCVAMVALSLSGEEPPPQHALALAAIAGLAGVMGLAAFYAALAVGPMSLVAPAVAVIGAALPAAVGLLGGETLTAAQLAGLAAAVVAVGMVSGAGNRRSLCTVQPAAFARTATAGLSFATLFVLIDVMAAAGG